MFKLEEDSYEIILGEEVNKEKKIMLLVEFIRFVLKVFERVLFLRSILKLRSRVKLEDNKLVTDLLIKSVIENIFKGDFFDYFNNIIRIKLFLIFGNRRIDFFEKKLLIMLRIEIIKRLVFFVLMFR